jgi:hypothetical protein
VKISTVCQQIQPPLKIQKRLDFFVVDVELEGEQVSWR